METLADDDADGSMVSDTGTLTRSSLTLGYDNVSADHPDMIGHLLKTIESLETELGYLPHKWQYHWGLLEPPPAHPPPPPPGITECPNNNVHFSYCKELLFGLLYLTLIFEQERRF